ncbi:alpha-glucosidase (family GH31 glycosyl hydrolase) [Breznakia sp. PF5-3]|uniref:discoidin domain-containing protein n=1 Tax=unclassified Breznakia TaxID=2623764 RepID=UPI0024059537|nr:MULTISPECIES: discoidin domain-containing protein [unclassified Breznakia]MDF9825451.1 alpha-glucosidase (family GH31 glycosyl hydrolase) [Breznakia sp. PM6-1]MDF9836465.1 alpha-glucosidase (family GH31 glycosyl hydrolase) [Breznakia sp. PF5-3]MDF9838493.1 alpha-glucosidase (family GH31 glycosyl hydrolase) [Breznakia sp. PFB2-8]MDF9860621.1 alpha-glucosidase (family GH31 glycosyl hydrolase) [Breznakia sp. PH5-24]
MKKALKRLKLLSLAAAMTLPILATAQTPVYADEIGVQSVDADGYNVLGSVLSASKDGNKVELTISTGEKIRFTFLESSVFRMYMAPQGEAFKEYPDANSAEHTATITAKTDAQYTAEYNVNPTLVEEDSKIIISTDKMIIEIDKDTSMMTLMKSDRTIIWEESAPLKYKSGSTVQTLKTNKNEYFYGGGTQNGRFSHKGKAIEIVNTNNWVDKGVASPNPFYWSTNGYGVVRNTWKAGNYDFDSKAEGVVKTTHREKRFDAYYFVDDAPVDILGDYYELTGNPAELPEYASYLGHLNCYNRDYWTEVSEGTSGAIKLGSKWYKESQTDNGGTKETLLGDNDMTAQQIIEDHKDNDMPLGWFLPNDGYGCGYGQTTSQAGDIENLKNFADYAKANGVETGLWTQSNLWPADPSNPQKGERDIYKEVEAGVHSVKTDVAWVGSGYSMALNGISVAYDAIASKSGLKPNIVTLDGWAGTQRYGGIWSGDQSGGQWEYIRFHIPTYIGTSLSGQPNIGSDMDGIFGGKNKVVHTRDFQWKAFTTYMLDMDGWGSNQKSPWALGEDGTSINRAYLKLKAQLMPYVNTTSHEATARGGLPMIRAMFLEEANAYTLGTATEYQYMWGDNFLVAPIYQNTNADSTGNDIRNDIYLPGTSDVWIDYFTGEHYRGGQVLNSFNAPLWKLPVFVKNGSIIPMYPENNNPDAVTETNKDGLDRSQRIVEFYPHGDTEFELYEDDGLTLGGASATTVITSKVDGEKATLTADKAIGSYTGMVKERSNEFIVNVSQKPTNVTGKVAGESVNFTEVTTQKEYDEATGNVYFYNENPDIFVKQFATEGTTYANTTETTRPKLYVKSAEKVDVTAHKFEVVVDGFKNEQDLGKDELNEALAVPTGLVEVSKTDAEINIAWDAVTEAATYDVEVDGQLYRNVANPAYTHTGLKYLTDHTYRVRSVNHDGFSNWSELITIQTADNPYRNVPENIKAKWDYGYYSSDKIEKAFDHDRNTMFHSASAVTPDKMVEIDLGAAYQLDKLDYVPRENKSNGAVYRMDVYASLDGVNYTKVWDGNANPAWSYDRNDLEGWQTKTVPLTGLKARYLKLSCLSSYGGFFSAAEITPYKVEGTDAWVVGDVTNNNVVDENDLTFYENYVGLKPVDADWNYSTLGNIDNNDIIDAYDISFVARMLGDPIATAAKGVEGKVQIIPSKTNIEAGDLVTLDFYGIGLKNVNAFSMEMPVDMNQFEVVNFGSPSTKTVFMRNFSKTRFHSDGTTDNYVCFTNVGNQELISGTGSIAKVTIRATRDFTWDTKATRALLVGQDLSTADALIDSTQIPEAPKTEYILQQKDISAISFDNAVKQNMDGSELWQQDGWKTLLFDGDRNGDLAEFKWYFEANDVAAEVMLPTDMNFTFNKSEPLKSVKVYNRSSSNGRVTSIKAVGYDGETKYDLGTINTAQNIYEFKIPAAASKIDKVVIIPLTSVGTAKGTKTGTEENRMLSLHEIEFITDSKVDATGIKFDTTSDSKVFVGGMGEVSATVSPSNVSNPFYNITSSDEAIAKVVKIPMNDKYAFVVQGVSAGTVTLTATSEDGNLTDTFDVTVVDGIDTAVLDEEIAKAEALYENLYTAKTWADMSAVLEDAKLLSAEPTSQTDVDAMTTKLITIVKELKFKGSNTEQESSLNLIDRSDMTLFHETSYSAAELEHGDRVLDGDINTIWHSNYGSSYKLPQWIVIDLGKEYDLEQIDMLARQSSRNGHITHYRIEVSTTSLEGISDPTINDLEFVPVVEGYLDNDGSSLEAPSVAKEIKFDTTKARYVKFMAIESLGDRANAYASIAELNFYGLETSSFEDLQAAIEAVEALFDKEDNYTTSSWNELMDAYDAASAVEDTATPSEINDALLALEVAQAKLTTRASDFVLDKLVELVSECEALEDLYTEAEFADMKALLDEVNELLENDPKDIPSADAIKATIDLLAAKETLQAGADVNTVMESLKLHIEIANEMLAEDLSGVRPGRVKALQDAVDEAQALVDASSTDVAAMQAAIVKITDASQKLWDIVDKTELNDMITIANKYTSEGYTEESWEALDTALKAAKTVAANDDATTAEVAKAYKDLVDAISGLEKEIVLDKEALIREIATVENMIKNISKYVPSSVKGLPNALTAAKNALENATTQKEIDDATKALTREKLKARLKPDTAALRSLVAKADGIKLDGYSASSSSKFANALANAKQVLANEEATAEEIETVVKGLKKAMNDLEKAKPSTAPNGTGGSGKAATAGGSVNSGDSTDLNALLFMMMVAGAVLLKTAKKRRQIEE